MTELTLIEKRHLARALYQEVTGEPAMSDWSHISEKNLDVLIICFRRMIDGDQEMAAVVLEACMHRRPS